MSGGKQIVESTRELVEQTGIDPHAIAGISFSGQMMGQVPVSKDGTLLLERVPIWADGLCHRTSRTSY